MKYNLTAKFYGLVFYKLLASYYKKHFPEVDLKQIKKDVIAEYKAMVERTPGIGGKKNYLEGNLNMACFFFAMGKKIDGMTPELLDKIIDEGIRSDFMVKIHKGARKKGTLFLDKNQDKIVESAKRSQTSEYEMDWKYTYVKGKDEFYCTYTKCGICELARREHMEKFLPCLCRTDYASYEIKGGKLIRTKTLANGDECCNFHVVRIKEDK